MRRLASRHMLAQWPIAHVTFATLDYDHGERFQTLRRELGVSAFGINLILLAPRERARIHSHDHQEEVYLVLAGELTLIVEGTEHVLGDWSPRARAREVRRQLVNAGARAARAARARRRRRARRPRRPRLGVMGRRRPRAPAARDLAARGPAAARGHAE